MAFATQANKVSHKMEMLKTCVLCGGIEDVHHAIVNCPHARSLRQAMRDLWALPGEKELSYSGHEGLLRIIDKVDTEMASKLILLLWRAWFVRNELTHSGRKLSIVASVGFLKNY